MDVEINKSNSNSAVRPRDHNDPTGLNGPLSALADCNESISKVETLLSETHQGLSAMLNDIKSLQERTQLIQTRHANAAKVTQKLNPHTDKVCLVLTLIKQLAFGDISYKWVQALQQFNQLYKSDISGNSDPHWSQALEELKPVIQEVKKCVVHRARQYIVLQIRSIRSSGVPKKVQETKLMPCKDLYKFLFEHKPRVAQELRLAYCLTMNSYYSFYIDHYRNILATLALDKGELIASNPVQSERKLAIFTSIASPSSNHHSAQHQTLALGTRGSFLDEDSEPLSQIIGAKKAEESSGKVFLYEQIYCSLLVVFIENSRTEYTFISEMFALSGYDENMGAFSQIFNHSMNEIKDFLHSILRDSIDAIGILIAIRFTNQQARRLQLMRIPILENFTNGLLLMLWPLFQVAIDKQGKALHSFSAASIESNCTIPVYITQRFSSFVAAIAQLSAEQSEVEPALQSLNRLLNDFIVTLKRIAENRLDESARPQFLNNNLSLVAMILSDAPGKIASNLRSALQKEIDLLDI